MVKSYLWNLLLDADMQIRITKADGEVEHFDPAKLRASLMWAGATSDESDRILQRVHSDVRDGATTEDIYHHAFQLLQEHSAPAVAARYSIKRALFALGPSGFPFEQFVASVLQAHGWRTQTGVALTGRCAPHEVDVLAEKDGFRVGIEAKFHNDAAGKTDIKDALYVHARYEDLKKAPEASSRVQEGWLVTNTRFTRNAIRYAQCSNLTLIGWDFPRGNGLQHMIETGRVHPLTCLTTLTDSEKHQLMDKRIVLCRDVLSPHLLEEYGVQRSRIPRVVEEARFLCTPDAPVIPRTNLTQSHEER